MSKLPEVLYRVTWMSSNGELRSVTAPRKTASEVAAALRATMMYERHGVSVAPATVTQGRHASPQPPVDEPLTGAAAEAPWDHYRSHDTGNEDGTE